VTWQRQQEATILANPIRLTVNSASKVYEDILGLKDLNFGVACEVLNVVCEEMRNGVDEHGGQRTGVTDLLA
jgi:hypothetical protein